MNKMTVGKFVGVLLVAVLAGVMFLAPAVAYAESGGGNGVLEAQGDGLAGVRGNGEISIKGNGVLWIKDHAGDAEISVSGKGVRHEMANGWVRYSGFSGEVHVCGSNVTAALSGYDIDLTANGTGRFILRGNGHYHTGTDAGDWSSEIQVMRFP